MTGNGAEPVPASRHGLSRHFDAGLIFGMDQGRFADQGTAAQVPPCRCPQ
ncbi:hypothetical protein ARZXY2_1901 [Arthrobacter sp. ZXY-2]|nr:hypothetical protein ARZXY2_1901 [Arthrobacter sp. ZXY-2]